MERLKRAIEWKERWQGLMPYIEHIEDNIETNPNISLDATKSILECIAKTILNDKNIEFKEKEDLWPLVKKSFSHLPVFVDLDSKDKEYTIRILSNLEWIVIWIGSLRNKHWFLSHWNDLQAKKFDCYLLELAISACDVLSSFLIIAHSEDFKDRSRIYYDECTEFNAWFDENNDSLEIAGIYISASRALFDQDIEAYKDEYYKYQNDSTALIDSLENIDEDDVDKAEKITTSLKWIPTISQEDVERFTDKAKIVVDSYNKAINNLDYEKINTDLTERMDTVLKNIKIVSNDEYLQKNIANIQERINKIRDELEEMKNKKVEEQKREMNELLNRKIKPTDWSKITIKDLKNMKNK